MTAAALYSHQPPVLRSLTYYRWPFDLFFRFTGAQHTLPCAPVVDPLSVTVWPTFRPTRRPLPASRREPLPRPARLSLTLGPAHRVLPPRACARSRVRERACARERANKPQTRIDQSKALVGPSVFDLLFGVGFQRPMKSSRCAAKQAPPTNEIAWSIRHFEFLG